MKTTEFVMEEPDVPVIQKTKQKVSEASKLITPVIMAGKVAVGLSFIFFGLSSTGSFYTSAGKMSGVLATVFYEWQIGTLLSIIGSILIYDVYRTFKNL